MHTSTRLSVATHILVALARGGDVVYSSERLAQRVNTNAVVIRRIVGKLREAGLVTCRAGVKGGVRLLRQPQDITLLDIYRAVEEGHLFRMHDPNQTCALGCTVVELLQEVYSSAEDAMETALAGTTLDQLAEATREAVPVLAV